MCGIVGVLDLEGAAPPDPATLEAMAATLDHRGPDGRGVFIQAPIALAMRRLSIIDLEGGDQPIGNEDGSVQIVFNGEIYNYAELRRELRAHGHIFRTQSDTETVIHAYEQWGREFLSRLNGMFAFALWDARARRLLLARDRAGIKPLYYSLAENRLIFGSELKALLAHPSISRSLDLEALSHYLSLEYVPAPKSIIRGVSKLRPGHSLEVVDGRIAERPYWDFDLTESERHGDARPIAQCAHALREVLSRAVEREMVSDVPVGVLLSGGLDSSSVAAFMTEHSSQPVQSFSITFAESSFDEGAHARRVANHLGTEHHELRLAPAALMDIVPILAPHLDEPFADPSIVPTYMVSRFARERVKVVLGGDGGDEALAGYSTLQAHRLAPFYRAIPRAIRQALVEPAVSRIPVSQDYLSLDFKLGRFIRGADQPPGVQHQMWTGAFYEGDKDAVLAPAVQAEVDRGSLERLIGAVQSDSGAAHPLNRILYQDVKLYLEGDILTKVDRASMAVSLEARVPFLNVEVLDFVARTPINRKLRGFRRKFLLREAMRGLLPSEIIGRRKQGFSVPVAAWLCGDLKGFALDYLNEGRIRREGLFSPAFVSRLLAQHFERRRNNAKMLWTLLMFQLWREQWLEPN